MGDATMTGEIDAKHFLIAIIAIVAIVALAFTVVYATGGLRGAAYYNLGSTSPYTNEGEVVLNWECFHDCVEQSNTPNSAIDVCKQACS